MAKRVIYRPLIKEQYHELKVNSQVNLRQSPNGRIIGKIVQAAVIKGTKDSNTNWIKVTYKGKTGYIYLPSAKI